MYYLAQSGTLSLRLRVTGSRQLLNSAVFAETNQSLALPAAE
jgi:hypothetical protein